MRKDVSFPLKVVEVLRGASDGNGFLDPSHPSIWYLFQFLGIVPIKHVILDGGMFC